MPVPIWRFLSAYFLLWRFGWHSLIAAYGLPPEKVIFIPHGVVLPQSTKASKPHRQLLQDMTLHGLHTNADVSEGMQHINSAAGPL